MLNYYIFLTKTFLGKLNKTPNKGQGLPELALILFLVAVATVAALRFFGVGLRSAFEYIFEEIQSL